MALFENLVLLLFVAALLLAGSRRLGLPYPTLLSVAGVAVAFLPFSPTVEIDPRLALVIFIAPALLDAAYDTAPRDLRRLWVPLLALVVGAVVITTATVAFAGWSFAGLPVAAAVALGAIVAPTDAVAVNAVTNRIDMPRHGSLVIQGESLLNDATALLIFGIATTAALQTDTDSGLARIALAVPGGVLLGLILGKCYVAIAGAFSGTLSSIIMQFTGTFGVWLLADRLGVSPVLAVVSYAMVIGQIMPGRVSARDRVQSYAVWAAVVFILNVLAFLFMGLQTRAIIVALPHEQLWPALRFALLVLATVITVRIIVLFAYHAVSSLIWRKIKPSWLPRPLSWRATLVLSWCGTRGTVDPGDFLCIAAEFPRS